MRSRKMWDQSGNLIYEEVRGEVILDNRYVDTTDAGFMVMPDIQPYKTVAADIRTGKPIVINSRSEHKEFLRRNGYEELGNDKPKPKEVKMSSPKEMLRYLFNK